MESNSFGKHYVNKPFIESLISKRLIKIIFYLLLVFGLTFAYISLSRAQKPPKVDIGKHEFETRCANCHGRSGKGDGWLADFLIVRPTDLTTLARKNGGVLPTDQLYQSIWGNSVPIHGPSDMPAWGRTYRREAPQVYFGGPYYADIYAQGRILILIEYISRLQVK